MHAGRGAGASKAGNYVGGAFQGEELVGASLAFFGPPAAAAMHSHVTAVMAGLRSRSLGFVIKQHQRAWALRHGATQVSWTYDPLCRRNAYFNLSNSAPPRSNTCLNFYGQMTDAINAGDESDRLVCRLGHLGSDRAVQASRATCPRWIWPSFRRGARSPGCRPTRRVRRWSVRRTRRSSSSVSRRT